MFLIWFWRNIGYILPKVVFSILTLITAHGLVGNGHGGIFQSIVTLHDLFC